MERPDALDTMNEVAEPSPAEATEPTEPMETPSGPAPLARFDGVVKRYGDLQALGPLTLTLERGCVGLLGPNGAGKSTLIRIMMGLLHADEGRVELLGEEVRPGSRDLRRRIGFAPEGEAQFPELTGIQAVTHAGRLVGMSRADAVQRAHQVLDYVGLGEARYRYVDTYSTGMRQRLKIAQALVHDPELLILDEPTEGVDPQAREEILNLISELVREHGIQLILSTHLLHDVERIATHALILHQGRVVEHGPIRELRTAKDRGYQVRLNGPAEPLMERLDRAGIVHQWAAPTLRVLIDDPRVLLEHVHAAGLVVRHLTPVELSLDEVFEAAVRRPQSWAEQTELNGASGSMPALEPPEEVR